ncbi:N-terminal nucleophile aminohydrolase [Panus rudis PR-1116 ss-1]|nr:N-terminal nucleophile aminohydrolase [Panus rudis PR-1116 ss-1]
MASETDLTYVIAVHGGAGYHTANESSETELKKSLRSACRKAMTLFRTGGEVSAAVNAVVEAIASLEDSPCLNAGHGSNLTLDGNVECDASIMDGKTGDFGSVGAITGVKNPVKAARAVLENSRTNDPVGRIPPLMLVSRGAEQFARVRGVEMIPPELLITPRAQRDWERWTERLKPTPYTGFSSTTDPMRTLHDIQDTVGAVAWDPQGGIAAGVSSGGLLLKQPGRVGEAAIFGAGCWAQVIDANTDGLCRKVACSVSGTGEFIMRCLLAKSLAEILVFGEEDSHDVLERILTQQFYGMWSSGFYISTYHFFTEYSWNCYLAACRSRGYDEAHAGVLLLEKTTSSTGKIAPRLWCAFTTDSMAIAYASSFDEKPKAKILRRPPRPATSDKPSVYITALPLS